MNILDEDIDAIQRERLLARKIHFRQIGLHVGRFGMKDRNDVIPLLHTLRRPTFFTRDRGFYDLHLLHPGYCLVYLDVNFDEVADYIRRFLRHPEFRAQAQRMGKVVHVSASVLTFWQTGIREARSAKW